MLGLNMINKFKLYLDQVIGVMGPPAILELRIRKLGIELLVQLGICLA